MDCLNTFEMGTNIQQLFIVACDFVIFVKYITGNHCNLVMHSGKLRNIHRCRLLGYAWSSVSSRRWLLSHLLLQESTSEVHVDCMMIMIRWLILVFSRTLLKTWLTNIYIRIMICNWCNDLIKSMFAHLYHSVFLWSTAYKVWWWQSLPCINILVSREC